MPEYAAIQEHDQLPAERISRSTSYVGALRTGETLVADPDHDPPLPSVTCSPEATIEDVAINSEAYEDDDHQEVPAGKAVLWTLSGTTRGQRYVIAVVTRTSDGNILQIECIVNGGGTP